MIRKISRIYIEITSRKIKISIAKNAQNYRAKAPICQSKK